MRYRKRRRKYSAKRKYSGHKRQKRTNRKVNNYRLARGGIRM